jgi:hypothetical protein
MIRWLAAAACIGGSFLVGPFAPEVPSDALTQCQRKVTS